MWFLQILTKEKYLKELVNLTKCMERYCIEISLAVVEKIRFTLLQNL